ncbi:hypothetical protein GOZ78_04270 [Agrobacterium vitis]|uniref:Phosphoribosyltransferase domain-containing protein n=2 Tax=Agrobacterium vitis TaxID=373 RepID=A0ABD6GGL4_AGRVI|nr:phosphoribosyltransferase family protein [Agrobacterium vitis]MUO81943.1 hypothetical protein [Agrobacterium vitis]MUO97044.1 hypothetical protein [Agrobacterium vitis]MUP08091.1 hypothetical protein [Agrobacterium vitis]MUZ80629.1 hypothetical protein [Agrobacterium vitis]MVA09235.1 hypothetical protein [Agrobacterium vitis]
MMLRDGDRQRLLVAITESMSATPLCDSNGIMRPRYLNSHKLLASPAILRLCSEILHDFVQRTDATYLVGLAMGGCCLAGAISVLSVETARPIPVAMIRDREKTHGYVGLLNHDIGSGQKVCIIDDVISTGASMRRALDILARQDATVVGIAAAIRRGDTGVEALESLGHKVRTIVDLYEAKTELTASPV